MQFQPRNLTVQGVLQRVIGMILRLPDGSVRIYPSSRTDAGVHALQNAACVELPPTDLGPSVKPRPSLGLNPHPPYDPQLLMAAINHLLWDLGMEIRVTGCRTVSHGFCAQRHSKLRTYLYRLAVLKSEFDSDTKPLLAQNAATMSPLVELDRCWFIGSNFDFSAFKAAGEEFIGRHNFACFMSTSRDRIRIENDFSEVKEYTNRVKVVDPVRFINHVGVEGGSPLLDPRHEPLSAQFNYFDVSVVAKAFLYNQIRRMVGSMVGVAQHRASLEDIRWLLENSGPQNWNKYSFKLAPPGGLYLKSIEYDPKDFEHPQPRYNTERLPEKQQVMRADEEVDGAGDEMEIMDDAEIKENRAIQAGR